MEESNQVTEPSNQKVKKSKNPLEQSKQATAGLTVCIGVFMVISCIFTFGMLSDMDPSSPEYADIGLIRSTVIIMLLFSIALIVLGALFCSKKRKDKGICVAIMTLIAVLTVLQVIGMVEEMGSEGFGSFDVLLLIWMIGVIIYSIKYLVELGKLNPNKTKNDVFEQSLGTKTNTQIETTATQTLATDTPTYSETAPDTPTASRIDDAKISENRIEMLKRLHADGIISKQELKESIKKELDNM